MCHTCPLCSQFQKLLPQLHFMLMSRVRAVPSSQGCRCATAVVRCNAASLSTSNKQDTKGHPEITAVPELNKDSPRALEAPRDMQSPRDWLQSYAPTPQPSITHTPSLLLQPQQQKVLTQQPATPAPSAPHELPTAAKPCSIPPTPTVTQLALGNTQGLSHYSGHTTSGQVLSTHSTGGDTPTCGHTMVALLRHAGHGQNKTRSKLACASHSMLLTTVWFTCRSAQECTHAMAMQTDVPGKAPGRVTLVGLPPVFRKQPHLDGAGLRAENSAWPLNGSRWELQLSKEGNEYVLALEE